MVAGSFWIARASSALESPAASRASSIAFTTESIVAIRTDSTTYSRRNSGSSRSRTRSAQNVPRSVNLHLRHQRNINVTLVESVHPASARDADRADLPALADQ